MKIDKARKFSNQSKYSGSVASGRMTDDEDKPKGTEKAKRIIKGDSASAAGAQTRGRLLSLGPKDGRVSGVKRAEDAVKKGREKEKEDKFNQVLANIKPDAKPEQVEKKEAITKRMNDELKSSGILPQPDLDMEDILENGDFKGEGIQGAVSLSPDGKTVVKQGAIGRDELEALSRMKDHPSFPTLLNARFDGPFGNIDPVKNNPQGVNPRAGKFYQDHNYGENFYEKFPGAPGMFAMSTAKGDELHDVPFADGDEEQYEMTKKIHQLRRDMHKQGIAHNDMHGGNVFYDEDSGDLSMLDFGLASVSPIRALMEGLGGINGASMMDIMDDIAERDEAGDYQLADEFRGHGMSDSDHFDTEQMGKMFRGNVDNIRQTLMDAMDVDVDDEDAMSEAETRVRKVP